jgi:hypothetical protein
LRDRLSLVLGPSEAAAKRRRRIVRVSVVVVAILLFVVAPIYIALQPKFFERYPAMEKYYDTWGKSVHSEVTCQMCHVSTKLQDRALYTARMAGEFYLDILPISRNPKLQGAPPNDTCESCHIDLRSVSPAGDLRIPHKAHVEVLKIDCVACHETLVHTKNINGGHAPTMEMCLKCHNGKKAKNACDTCHTDKGMPQDHKTPDWQVVHSQKKNQVDCQKCHGWTEKWCAECHSRKPKAHTVDWRATHQDEVEKRRNCEACHDGTFCVKCHGEVPQLNYDPALQRVQ